MLRRCFEKPIPEFALAADLLSAAADALLAGDASRCFELVLAADLRPLREFAYRVAGPINFEIHRQHRNPSYISVPKDERPRMPTAAQTRALFVRDGYRCRFCESRVVIKEAITVFTKLVPNAVRTGDTNEERHFGLSTLTASIDHILPFSRGGGNDPSNLVTACGPCQFGRNRWTLEEVAIENPFNYAPICDSWDGLSRLLKPQGQTRGQMR